METFELTFDLTRLTLLPSGHGSFLGPCPEEAKWWSASRWTSSTGTRLALRPDTPAWPALEESQPGELATCGRGSVRLLLDVCPRRVLFKSFSVSALPDLSTATTVGLLNMSRIENKNYAFFYFFKFWVNTYFPCRASKWAILNGAGAQQPHETAARTVRSHAPGNAFRAWRHSACCRCCWLRSRARANAEKKGI